MMSNCYYLCEYFSPFSINLVSCYTKVLASFSSCKCSATSKQKIYFFRLVRVEARYIPIPCDIDCGVDLVNLLKQSQSLFSSVQITQKAEIWNKFPHIEIRGRSCRDVDMVGAQIYSFLVQDQILHNSTQHFVAAGCSVIVGEAELAVHPSRTFLHLTCPNKSITSKHVGNEVRS